MEAKAVEFHFCLDVFRDFSKCYSKNIRIRSGNNHTDKLAQNDVAIYAQYFILHTTSPSAKDASRSKNKAYLLFKGTLSLACKTAPAFLG